MSIAYDPLGFAVPGPYREPPAGAPVASLAAEYADGYATGPPAPLLTDFGPEYTEWNLQDALMVAAGRFLRSDAVDPNIKHLMVLRGDDAHVLAVRAGDVVPAGTLGTPLLPTTPVPPGTRRAVAATLMAVPAGPTTPERVAAAAAVQRLLTIEGLARHAFRLASPRAPPLMWARVLPPLRARAAAAALRAGHTLFDDEL